MFDSGAWKLRGLCSLTDDPNIFYPERGQPTKAAKAMCARCPVRQECLETALGFEAHEDWGIWGGTSRDDRARLRRTRGITRKDRRFREKNTEIQPVSV